MSVADRCKLPHELERLIIDKSYLLAVLFQELGYVGRCSFDLILFGEQLENCRLEFIECNARWGGTSIPMTLMNRLQIDRRAQTYSILNTTIPGLDQFSFADLIRELDSDLYDSGTGSGVFILTNPGRVKAQSAIDVIAIGSTAKKTDELLEKVLRTRLEEIIYRANLATESAEKIEITPASKRVTGLPIR